MKRMISVGLAVFCLGLLGGIGTGNALGWENPTPGSDYCVPKDGAEDHSAYMFTNAQEPYPSGSYKAEDGKCEGPIVKPPHPGPLPSPCGCNYPRPPGMPPVAQPPAPVAPPAAPTPPPASVPVPPAGDNGLCTPRRRIKMHIPTKGRYSSRTSLVTVYRPITAVTKIQYMYQTKTWSADGEFDTAEPVVKGDNGQFETEIDFTTTPQGTPFRAIRGMPYVVKYWAMLKGYTLKTRFGTINKPDKEVYRVRSYRLCIPNDNDLNTPTEQRKD